MRRVLLAAVCVFALLSPASEAQDRQQIMIGAPGDPVQMPGMAPRDVKTGTARIRGRVLSVDTGTPVRRVQVRVSGPDVGMKIVTTDEDGRFEFRQLPGGRFSLSAMKSGYVSVQYGQTRPFESGKPIELADGQLLDKADILIPRGSAISGRILDEFGEPVTDAMVAAMRSVWSNGRRRLQPAGRMATTNDLGQFRLYGLPGGDYVISATLRDMTAMEFSMNGGPTPGSSVPAAGYAPTYFPGTASGSDAQKITVVAGQDAHNTDFALLPVRLARITGVVIGSDGKPVSGSMVSAMPRSGDNPMGMMLGGSSRTNRDGTFTLAGLPPGDYMLQSRSMQIMTSGSGDMMTFSATVGGPGAPESESGSTALSLNGEDIGNVVITSSKGATASGQVTFEDGAKPSNPAALRLTAVPTSDISMMGSSGPPAAINPDNTFELRGLTGARVLRLAGLPPGWVLKSVIVNGADVTDTGMDFKGTETVTGVEIVVTSRVTELSGAVKGSSGAPLKDYTIIVFSDDPGRWTIPNSRFVVSARPDQDGNFKVRGLPPGGYYAAAADYVAQGEWGDPELLDRLKAKASRVSLDDGEKKLLDLKLVDR